MYPTLSFTYLHIYEFLDEEKIINYIDNLISLAKGNIQEFYDKYVLLSIDNDKLFHDCIIYEIMKDDLIKLKNIDINLLYNKLRLKYEDNLINKIILDNEAHIMKKIYDIIKFTFKKIYKGEEIITIIIDKYDNPFCSIPDIVYSSILSCSKYIFQKKIDNKFIMNISRRI